MAAVRAGIGWQGTNSLIISEEFGSWLTLCCLVINKELESDESSTLNCGSCMACQHACPTSATQSPGIININKCIDYLTVKTGAIPNKLRSKIGNRLISCDRCQEVCPYNKNVNSIKKEIPPFNPKYRYSPSLLPLLDITEEDFQRYYSDTEFIEPSREHLQRNILVALGNICDPVAVPILNRYLKEGSPLLRDHAGWALEQISHKNSK